MNNCKSTSLILNAFDAGRYEEVLHSIDELGRVCKLSLTLQMLEGHSYYELTEYQKAQEIYNRIADEQENPAHKNSALFHFGLALKKAKKYSKAVQVFKSLAPFYENSGVHVAQCYNYLNDSRNALISIEEYLSHFPKDSEALYLKGAFLNQLDRHEESLSVYQGALNCGAQDFKIVNGLLTAANWCDRKDIVVQVLETMLNSDIDPEGKLHAKAKEILEDMSNLDC